MSDPVTDFFAAKTAAQTQRTAKDQQLWQTWKQEGQKPAHLEPLLKAYQGVFAQHMKKRPPTVPESAYKAELQSHFIRALDTYDPSKAALNTHVENRLRKALRYGNRHANIAYVPEGKASDFGKIDKAKEELYQEFGRDPTHVEIANHLGLTPKRIEMLQKARIADIPASHFENDPTERHNSFEDQQIALAQHILPDIFPGQEDLHTLFHYTFGTGGKPQVHSTTELAKIMGKSQSQISRMKTVMGNKLKTYMGPGQGG